MSRWQWFASSTLPTKPESARVQATVIPSASANDSTVISSASPGKLKRLPHPVVFRILARRRLASAAKYRQGSRPGSILPRRRRKAKPLDECHGEERQLAALQAELAWQRGTPLVFENLDRLYPDMRDEVLGNRILRLIELTDACHPCKVTGMILEGCSTRELFDMLRASRGVDPASPMPRKPHALRQCQVGSSGSKLCRGGSRPRRLLLAQP